MINNQFIINKFGFLGNDFLKELDKHAVVTEIKAKTEIVREGQKNKFVPFLIKGSIRVFSLNDGRELIYYYIRSNDSCLMTFSSIFTDYTSRIYAVTEEDSEVLLFPVSVVHEWLIKFPEINRLFYSEYDKRFIDVMNMVNDAVFHRLDKRVLNYVKQQISATGNNPIKLTHREIANSLGTSREVVSRVLKKIENEGEIIQTKEGIKIPVNENVSQG
ncbi:MULTISPECIES: Crp/Fnr family transcriptional regulator [Chryseobacterium]|uniref:Crp/Fnr family transcriptional regulator n=2 Tax=Chryseobacterium TaxID=59732 RepID=A0A1N7LHP1_9FLAO|nr:MULTISPECIES: Crp/Fnr family transcriptional regulator [Chryseobacterium]MBL7879213.1 Crp/Fnr family transcriptional regulator [Chryseobacterium gambrini]MCQ4140828.1 Crp/Fnr family transcriptional regulator [Chryseobacterium sp. EO14]WBX99010.1 Crp/Fnr family transcriptional regulator [Chryseobacterium gambrini]SIS73337.1 CRP/FNR family transcriptional regulator, anaerobic regulatory protein [Chryseobacterium gambrini]BEV04552.1 Crp/Fnr family transcriptional regulator [Chryseobacterium ga